MEIPQQPHQAAVVDWSSLLPDILETIFSLCSFADRIRLSAVCSSWRSSISTLSKTTANTTFHPYLIHFPDYEANCNSLLYCFVDHHRYPAPLRNVFSVQSLYILHSSNGWLFLTDSATPSVFLLNPFSGSRIYLPPFSRNVMTQKMALSISSPSTATVVIICTDQVRCQQGSQTEIIYARSGDDAWISVDVRRDLEAEEYDDVIYSNTDNKFYVLDHCDNDIIIIAIDAADASIVKMVAGLDDDVDFHETHDSACLWFLASLPSGELLCVVRRLKRGEELLFGTYGIDVYKLERRRVPGWVRVKSMRDWAVFLGSNSSIVQYAASDTTTIGPKGNCIYITDGYSWPCEYGIFDMGDESISRLDMVFDDFDADDDSCRHGIWLWVEPKLN